MFKLFEPDGLFARGMCYVYYLVVINVLWLVCSLPVVTFGASSAALYACLFRLLEGDDTRPVRRFFAAFGENWKRATAAWLAVLAVLALLLFDWYFASVTDQPVWKIIAVGGLLLIYPGVVTDSIGVAIVALIAVIQLLTRKKVC